MNSQGMRVNTIYDGNITPGVEWNYTVGQGFLNGIVIRTGAYEQTELLVRIRHSDGTEVLVQNQSLNDFVNISSYDNQTDANKLMRQFYRVTKLAGVLDADNPYFNYYDYENSILIPLGAIYLGDAEIEIKLNVNGKINGEAYFSVGTYEDKRKPAHLLKYEEYQDLNSNYSNVDTLFAKWDNKDANNIDGEIDIRNFDADIRLDHEDTTDIGSIILFKTTSLMLAGVPVFDEKPFTQLFRNDSPVEPNVHVKITGDHANRVTLISRTKEYIETQTSDNTIKEYEKLADRVEELETKNSERAKAKRHAGEIEKSEEMKQKVETVKESKKADDMNKNA